MKDYTYDGTFEGLLCCIYAHYYDDHASSITPHGAVQTSLFTAYCDIQTDFDKAMRVQNAIENKISNFDLRRVYRVFLSCAPQKEMLILNYVYHGFQAGNGYAHNHADPVVYQMQTWDKRVGFEVHRMKGLVRFDELENGVMYSKITPDNDISELLAPHFVQRFQSSPFIIHDCLRSKAVIAASGDWISTRLTPDQVPAFSSGTASYSDLWQLYHEHIAIRERTNPRCQKNFMPVRYWQNLTEFK